jgi:DNA-binding SARP family transcriptional activator
MMISIRLLGRFAVTRDGRPIELPSSRQRTVLACLAVMAGEPVSADVLAERAWAPVTPVSPRNTLYTHLVRLRRALGADLISTAAGGYVLDLPAGNVDLLRFRELVRRSDEVGDPAEELRLLRAALALWQGEPFAGVTSGWLEQDVAPRLVEERLAATNRRIGLELAAGRPDDVLPELRELLAAYPLQEPLWEHLVHALHRAGRRGDALAAYGRARAVLREELGLDPGPRLRELHRLVLAGELPLPRRPAVIGRTSAEQPVVLVVEDLHLADSATVDALAVLAQALAKSAVRIKRPLTEAGVRTSPHPPSLDF